MAALLESNAGGCHANGVVFHDFHYSGDDPGSVGMVLIQNATTHVAGWSYSRIGGPWTSSFTIGYTVNTVEGVFVYSKDQMDSGLTGPNNGTTIQDTQTGRSFSGAPSGVISNSVILNLNGTSTAAETMDTGINFFFSIQTSSVVTIPSGSILIKYNQLMRVGFGG
jgi:hypothetical protein